MLSRRTGGHEYDRIQRTFDCRVSWPGHTLTVIGEVALDDA